MTSFTTINSANYAVTPPQQQSMSRLLRTLLLVLIGIAYSGALPFLFLISQYLLYSVYFAFIISIIFCVYNEDHGLARFKYILPYAAWIIIYCLWGILASPVKSIILPDAIRLAGTNILILAAIATALAEKTDVSRLAQIVQVIAIVNCGISIWGGDIMSNFSDSYIPNRPGGLWINPNGAAFSLLFALLLSYWTRGSLAWLGRCAALIGIYLATSRAIVYLLLLCTLLYVLHSIKSLKLTHLHLAMLCHGLALILCLGWLLSERTYLASTGISENWNIQRLLDASETEPEFSGDITRREVTAAAFKDVINGPLYGWGLFSFQRSGIQPGLTDGYPGAHDIYLVAWGELGIFGLLVYLIVLARGITYTLGANISSSERWPVILMWISYLLFGFTSHNMFSSMDGILGAALLYHLPMVLSNSRQGTTPLRNNLGVKGQHIYPSGGVLTGNNSAPIFDARQGNELEKR